MSETVESGNLVDQAYEQILSMLYDRGLADGGSLRIARLADTLGVSRTPVNMALVRLESEGLLEHTPGGGWTVVPLTLEAIDEIFDLKDVLDPMMARQAAERISPEMAERLGEVMAEMETASARGDVAAWASADGRFHRLLSEVAGNDRLRRFQQELNRQFYRLWVGYSAMEGRMAASCAEHRRIGAAVCAGDAEEAARAARDHTRNLRRNLIDLVGNVLAPFLGDAL